MTPQDHAVAVLGPVDWQSPTVGFCQCPGEASHTTRNGKKQCRVTLDGAPTVFCFHSHCQGATAKASDDLRRRISGADWTLILPGGQVLGSDRPQMPATATNTPENRPIVAFPDQNHAQNRDWALRELVRKQKAHIFDQNRWPYAEICASSPSNLQEYAPEDYFRRFLLLFQPEDVIWIGNVYDSGSLAAASHFRPVSEWLVIGPAMGNFTCPCVFKPGCNSRTDASVLHRRYLVVESDTLSRDEVGAVFRWLSSGIKLRLHCIVDTAGKSLHGWFNVPPVSALPDLKLVLAELGCDVKLFTQTQPVRLPGAFRDQKLQHLIWFKK